MWNGSSSYGEREGSVACVPDEVPDRAPAWKFGVHPIQDRDDA